MGIETEALAIFESILQMDDKELESGYDDLMKLFEFEGNFEQALIEKLSYCRANNLTEDDLLEENKITLDAFSEVELSPIKQKFISFLMETAVKVNNRIIEDGLYPKVKVRVERLPHNQKLPEYAHENGDSGLDVYTVDNFNIEPNTAVIARTGIKVAIPLGYELQVRPRSGMSLKKEYQNLFVANSPGTIDANYREEVGIILKNIGNEVITIEANMRIAQLVLAPVVKLSWVEVKNINDFPSDRQGGFGSSGEK
ncbi:MAG: dUTP diphosphatase [Bacteroidia bacterium]|nr:dUTP diphosphatase [Bacteroidia bacterium]